MKDSTFNEAKQLYLEQYASAIVTGGYLKIAVALLSLVVLGLVVMNLKIVRTLEPSNQWSFALMRLVGRRPLLRKFGLQTGV